MAVRKIDPSDRGELKRFVALDRDLHGEHPMYWAEPLADVRKRLSGRSAFSDELELALFLGDEDGRPQARAVAAISRRWQRDQGDDPRGGIGWLTAAPGADRAMRQVLDAAEEWLAQRDIPAVLAPFNGNAMLGFGLLTDGFDKSPMFPLLWNPPHLEAMLDAAGYSRRYPMWSYWVDFTSERYRRARDAAALAAPGCTIRALDKKRWKEELEVLRVVFNEGMRGEWEMQQFSPGEFTELFGPIKPVYDPRMMLFAEVDGEPAGIVFGFGDLTPLLRSFRGRGGPIQILQFLRRAKHFDRTGLLAIAVLDRFRGRGIGRALAARFFANVEDMGSPGSFYYPVNDHNAASRGLAESFGGEGRNDYHVFEKAL